MKYKYSVVFLTICVILLSTSLGVFVKNLSQVEDLPVIEYPDITPKEVEEEPLVKPEKKYREIPDPIRTEIEFIQEGDDLVYRNEKYGFEMVVPEDSHGTESVASYPNPDFYVRIQNYPTDTDRYGLDAGQYFLEMYVEKTTQTDPEMCVSVNIDEYEEIDLGQGITGYIGVPEWYGGDGPGNGVSLCTIRDGLQYSLHTRETVVTFDDEILKTFRFIE